MLRYKDFVPKIVKPAGFWSPAEHESFDAALADAIRKAWTQKSSSSKQDAGHLRTKLAQLADTGS